MPETREEFLLKHLQELRSEFRKRYGRAMTQEETMTLDFAEQLLKPKATKAKAAGEGELTS